MSTTYENKWFASYGVDGIKNIQSLIATNYERNPYWWVNLGTDYNIATVKIYSRDEGKNSRGEIQDIKVY